MTQQLSSARALELLAPARNLATGIAAIDCGADAVYIGGPTHGARAAAANSVEDIAQLCRYAHRFRAKVYVTVNTIIYENELDQVVKTTWDLYHAGVDALIVQDMAMLALPLPPIALHASTQCDTRTPQRAAFLADAGMSCVVLPREMSLDEIRAVHAATPVPLEVFVHGALCVSYSGDCRASLVNGGRSANRGECAQICRLKFALTDGEGNEVAPPAHYLSLRDLNRIDRLAQLAEAGASSFKIEGRLKDKAYVMNVVTAYSQALDEICAANPQRWRRASYGRTEQPVVANLAKIFNRGYTQYAIDGPRSLQGMRIATLDTPKHRGELIGTLLRNDGKKLSIKLKQGIVLTNGDGLGYLDSDGAYTGFRVNRVEGNTVYLTAPIQIKPGVQLYRNADKAFDDAMQAAQPKRVLPVDITLSLTEDGSLALSGTDCRGCQATVTLPYQKQEANSAQTEVRRRIAAKLGGTGYVLGTYTDTIDSLFVPASTFTALRRHLIQALDTEAEATRPIEKRRAEKEGLRLDADTTLSFHDNVANSVAEKFYADHGAVVAEKALEVQPTPQKPTEVMVSRHCIRRELGACLLTPQGSKLPPTLVLRDTAGRVRPMQLAFDCKNCLMRVIAVN